jgi:hypothetical protein
VGQEAYTFDPTIFNELPPVLLADTEARRNSKLERALQVLGPLFLEHGVCQTWGLGLLHRHWPISSDELPVQTVENKKEREFVMTPRRAPFSRAFWPSVWAVRLTGDGPAIVPTEFSTDPDVALANDVLTTSSDFINHFARTSINEGMAQSFGLVAARMLTSEECSWVEHTYDDRRSVVTEVNNRDIDKRKMIQTTWFFASTGTTSCTTKCAAFCDVSDEGHTSFHQTYHDPGGGNLRPVGNPKRKNY